MVTQKIIYFVLAVISLLSASCTTVAPTNKTVSAQSNSKLVLNPFWVKDSLVKPNNLFRKVNRMSPVVYKNQLIVGNAIDGLVSYNLDTKNELWRIVIPQGIEASATTIRDRLFVGSNNGKMYSVDLTKGQVLWFFDTKSEIVSEPLLQDGILYFLSGSQAIFALDAVSGKQLWTFNRQDTSNLMTIRGGSKPAFSNGLIYSGFSDGSVVALNAKTGTQQWEITLNKNTRFRDIDSSPVIDGEYIYINSYDDKIYCLSKNKGEILWKSPFGGSSTPLVFGDRLITTSSKGDLVALSKKDGAVLWKTKTNNGIYVDPSLLKGLVVTGESQGSLSFFDALTGEFKASFEPGRGVFSRPTIVSDKNTVYFISGEGNIYGVQVNHNMKSSIYYLK